MSEMLVKHPIFVVGNLKATNKMRRVIIIIMLAFVAIAGQAKDKVIDRPAFKQATSFGIMPTRVELTKDATIVHFHILCADRMGWNLESPRLEADGKTFAGQRGRILTREHPGKYNASTKNCRA